jgi:hypothetical protein
MNIKKPEEKSKADRLRELYKSRGFTQAQALFHFNTSRPKLEFPFSASAWSSYFVKEGSKRHRNIPAGVMERAERVFSLVKI